VLRLQPLPVTIVTVNIAIAKQPFPFVGPAHLSSLQQQVSALTLTIRAGQNDTTGVHQLDTGGMTTLDIPVAGGSVHQTDTCGSRHLEDTAVSNTSLECSWQDCLAAYHYLTVIKSLSHNKRHGDSGGTVSDDLTCHLTSDNGDTSIGVSSVDKPSTDDVPVASSVEVNVSSEAGRPRPSGDVYSETVSEVAEKSTGVGALLKVLFTNAADYVYVVWSC